MTPRTLILSINGIALTLMWLEAILQHWNWLIAVPAVMTVLWVAMFLSGHRSTFHWER
jgi:hypothetical protein